MISSNIRDIRDIRISLTIYLPWSNKPQSIMGAPLSYPLARIYPKSPLFSILDNDDIIHSSKHEGADPLEPKDPRTREERFVDLWLGGMPAYKAAEKAGYAPGYAKNILNKRLSSPTFQSTLQARAKGKTALYAPRIFNILDLCIYAYENNQSHIAIQKSKLLLSLMANLGLQGDSQPQVNITTINIGQIQAGLRDHYDKLAGDGDKH